MNKKIIAISLVSLFAIFAIGWQIKETFFSSTPSSTTPTVSTEVKSKISYYCPPDETVLDALIKSNNGTVHTKDKKLVLAINGLVQGDGKYWQYTVDGKYTEIGADKYKCNGGENIVWELK